ncbi:MAG: hypothetical protein ACRDY4_02810 [Acidimicrobiia bacterium]
MSTLWTPSGEHEPEAESSSGPAEAGGPGPGPELAEELDQLREQLAATPVADILANHAVGLWQLAIVHLAPEAQTPPRVDEARLAIDAMAALVEGLGDRLGEHEAPLRDALAQLRIAYVQVTEGNVPETPND